MGCTQSAPDSSSNAPPKSGNAGGDTNRGSMMDGKTKENQIEIAFKAKQRGNVFMQGVDKESLANFTPPKIPKNAAEMKFIRATLTDNYMFKSLSEADLKNLIEAMSKSQECSRSETIFTQGQEGDFMYIVRQGTFSVIINNKTVATLEATETKGKLFGELSLLYNAPRAATIRSESVGTYYTLDATSYKMIISQSNASRQLEVKNFLSKIPLLDGLSDSQFDKLCDTVELVPYDAGTRIFKKGDVGNIFYMIKEGTVQVSEIGDKFEDHPLKAGDYFGERALLTGEPRAATVTAVTNVVTLALDRKNFDEHLGPLREVLDTNANMRVIGSIKLFSGLSREDKTRVIKSFIVENYTPNTPIIRQGESGKKFYIIKEGSVKVEVNGAVVEKSMSKGQFFGEMALLNDDVRTATITATSPVECFVLGQEVFKQISGAVDISKEADQRNAKLKEQADNAPTFLNIPGDQLKEVALLGSGTFGRVTLVQDKRDLTKVYALKTMLKSEIVAQKQQTNVVNERNMMALCNHNFVLRLFQTYKDPKKLQMLLEFVQGGELFSVLHTAQRDGVDDAAAKFYAAGVILALGYLHDRDIAYRDMKPENCLIDKFGYPKIIDFGFAKVITGKSFTLCGTPEYLAPELILNRGHNKSVDYWAFGILVYEMQAGYSPFCDPQAGDQHTICKNIINSRCVYPPKFNKDCQTMCQGLLTREVQSRLGNLKGGCDDVIKSKWFSGINMDDYMKKKVKAPWVPKVKNDLDFSNFQPYDDDHVDKSNFVDRGNWDAEF